MKKPFLLTTVLLLGLLGSTQNSVLLAQSSSALVYSLPKTELCIEITSEKITEEPGRFFRYSERYLATNKVITEKKTTYVLKSIQLKTRSIADPNRTFSVIPSKNSALKKLSVNAKGILCGINVMVPSNVQKSQPKAFTPNETVKSTTLLPLGEEYMMAGSEAKLAEGVAKQIYRIRESRLGLLTSDTEKIPADGSSLKLMLTGLDNIEKQFTELFTGKTTSELTTKIVSFLPDSAITDQVLFRFSALRGLVTSTDLSGTPYYISVAPSPIVVQPSNSNLKSETGVLQYVQPVRTEISIGDGVNTTIEGEFFISQLGKTLGLPEALFKRSNIKVHIDPETGRLLTIE